LIFGSLLVMSILSTSNVGINYISKNNILVANAKSNIEKNDIPFILPLPMQKKMIDTTMAATATYATSTVADYFESGLYTLKGGQISPNGKWKDIYTGYGTVGVRQGLNNNEYMYLATKASTSKSETHAALVTTTKLFKNFDLTAKVMTQKQLRQNSPPNNWETAWIMWNWQDNYHQYSFNLKKIGYELQKKDNERQDNSAQVFLVTGKAPSTKIGVWQNWHLRVTGTGTGTPHIIVWIDGIKIIDYIDNKAGVPRNSLKMKQGGFIGLYADDAAARFDNVVIKPL
jgi:hypothetical protein